MNSNILPLVDLLSSEKLIKAEMEVFNGSFIDRNHVLLGFYFVMSPSASSGVVPGLPTGCGGGAD